MHENDIGFFAPEYKQILGESLFMVLMIHVLLQI